MNINTKTSGLQGVIFGGYREGKSTSFFQLAFNSDLSSVRLSNEHLNI